MRSLPEGKPTELEWHVNQVPLLIVSITEAALVGGFLYWAFKGGAATKKTKTRQHSGGGQGGALKVVESDEGPLYYDPGPAGDTKDIVGWDSVYGDRQVAAYDAFKAEEKKVGTVKFYKEMDVVEQSRIDAQAGKGYDRTPEKSVGGSGLRSTVGRSQEYNVATGRITLDPYVAPERDVWSEVKSSGVSTVTVNPGVGPITVGGNMVYEPGKVTFRDVW
jgi:hypothetical protein